MPGSKAPPFLCPGTKATIDRVGVHWASRGKVGEVNMACLPQFMSFHTVAIRQHKWDPLELLSFSTGTTSAWPAVPVKAITTKQSCGVCVGQLI